MKKKELEYNSLTKNLIKLEYKIKLNLIELN